MKKLRRQVAASDRDFPLSPDGSAAELNVESVSYRWPNGTLALDQCCLQIPHPGLWMLVGSNGSGKSTLFRLITGLLEPQSGSIRTNHRVALVFQNPDHQLLLPSCGSDLLLGMTPQADPHAPGHRIEKLLGDLRLSGMASRPIHTLSGGQKQRLAIAGALASEAGLLLLDEPTALLDPSSQRNVLESVQKLCRSTEQPLTALWITHRLEELDLADGAACMRDGRIDPWMTGSKLRDHLQCGRSGS